MHKFINLKLRLSVARALLAALLCALVAAPASLSAQEPAKKDDGKVPSEKELAKEKQKKELIQLTPGETVAELAILAYGSRKQLEAARSAIQEQGTIRLASEQGDITGNYNMRTMRKAKSWEDLLRIDLELTPPEAAQRQGAPSLIRYVIGFNGASTWSAQNGQYVNPRPEVEAAFRAQLTHDYTTLLRYKEDGSKVELIGPETVVGIDTNVVDLTTTTGEKTRFWVSTRTFRVMHLEYEIKLAEGMPPTKYRISYYYTPMKVVQNTLIPVRRVMMQDGKFAQEITLNNIVASAKFDPEIFQHLQEQ